MIDRRSDKELTSIELTLDKDLQVGEGSELIDAHESYISARDALLYHADIAMRGEGHSEEEEDEHVELLLSETSRTYARTVVLVDEDERIEYAARLMTESEQEFSQLGQKYSVNLDVSDGDVETVADSIREKLDETYPDEQEAALDELYQEAHDLFLRVILDESEENKNDLDQEKREHRKQQVLEMLRDSGKVALGVTAAMLVVRLIDKNK